MSPICLTKNRAKLLYKSKGISLQLNDICIQTEGNSTNTTFYIKHAQFPHPNLHVNPQNPNFSFHTLHEDFLALYNMCQYEKTFNFYQKQVDVFSAQNLAMQEVKEKNSVDFQSNLTTKIGCDIIVN